MKILLDECIPMVVYDFLVERSFEVNHVKHTSWAGFSNSVLYNRVQGEYQIFVTTDRHFTHPEKFKPTNNFGVVYLRVAPTLGPLLVKALDVFLEKVSLEEVIGKLVIVRREDHTIRE